jgi:hypothetical protein
MNAKSLPYFRFILIVVFFMQVAVTQAQEEKQMQMDKTSDWIVTDTVQEGVMTLSEFKNMNSRELDNFLKQNDREFFAKYRTGKAFCRIGIAAIIPGVLTISAGVVLITCFDNYRMREFGILGTAKLITWEYLAGIYVTLVGGVATIASTTFIIIGSHLKNKSKKGYITKYFNDKKLTQSTLKVGCTSNGIRLTLNF